MDAASAAALEAAWLYAALEPASAFGRRAYEAIQPFKPGQEAQAEARGKSIGALAASLSPDELAAMRDALRTCPDPVRAIARASMGEVLDDAHLLELLRFLDAAKRVSLVQSGTRVAELARVLEPGRAGKFGFYLTESFDERLARAREAADRAQAEFEASRGRLAQRIAAQLGRDDLSTPEFIVMRDTVAVLPQDVRVIREAPTYYLCELDLDEPALAALAKRDNAAAEVAAAEQRARAALSDAVRAALPELEALLTALAQADVDLALAHFVRVHECAPASIVPESRIAFDNGSFLPMKAQLAAQGRSYEPISIDLREASVITGPNMGGKSAALRTCGFLALLAAFGVPVPAANAHIGLFDEIGWLGGAEVETGLLSSFAAEVVRLNVLLSRPAKRMLLLIDEFARTTTPHEGGALLTSLLRSLRRRGQLGLAATHLANVAAQAGAPHYAVRGLRDLPHVETRGDLIAALEALAESMDYSVHLVDGAAAQNSDAIALAELLGLDEEIVAGAKEAAWNR